MFDGQIESQHLEQERTFVGASWMLSLLHGVGSAALGSVSKSSSLTFFPMPGEARMRVLTWLKPNVCTADKVSPAVPCEQAQPAYCVVSDRLMREFWMPDKLCRTCHECELPFNLFRRRHHCRFCGQVFCHSCTSNFVDGKSLFLHGVVRACSGCYLQFMHVSCGPVSPALTASGTCQQLQPQPPPHADSATSWACDERVLKRTHGTGSRFEEPGSPVACELRNPKSWRGDCARRGLEGKEPPRRKTWEMDDHGGADEPSPQDFSPLLSSKASSVSRTRKTDFSPKEMASPNLEGSIRRSKESHLKSSVERLLFGGGCGDSLNEHRLLSSNDTSDSSLHRFLGSTYVAPSSVLCETAENMESIEHALTCRQHLSRIAASHLSRIVGSLLKKYIAYTQAHFALESWRDIILDLVGTASMTVRPNTCAGDAMDVRPYVKFKAIPGGSSNECCYVDGLVFRKALLHKKMARTAHEPQVLLISSGIGFHRTHAKLTTFETLLEQEQKYTQIIIEKIAFLKPDILLVGQAVSRPAQEYLRIHDIIVIQHVKSSSMRRVARMTGAVILSSTDQVNTYVQQGVSCLGACKKFQCVSFLASKPDTKGNRRACTSRFSLETRSQKTAMHLAGANYIYISGCPKALGCTLIFRGEGERTLRSIKRIARFALFVAYHLRLESSFHFDRCSWLPHTCSGMSSIQHIKDSDGLNGILSSSVAVCFGKMEFRSVSVMEAGLVARAVSVLDHQSILVTSVWMYLKAQCVPAEIKAIVYYAPQDVCLGQFLYNPWFDLDLRFAQCERRPVTHATRLLFHSDGCLIISVANLENCSTSTTDASSEADSMCSANSPTLLTWSYCRQCARVVTPLVPVSEDTCNMSFGKFLEVMFYNNCATCRTGDCRHCIQTEHTLYFGFLNMTVRVNYEKISPYQMFVRRQLPGDHHLQGRKSLAQFRQLCKLSRASACAFLDKVRNLETVLSRILTNDVLPVFIVFPSTNEPMRSACLVKEKLHQVTLKVKQFAAWMDVQIREGMKQCKDPRCSEVSSSLMHVPARLHHGLHVAAAGWNSQITSIGQMFASICSIGSSDMQEGSLHSGSCDDDAPLKVLLGEIGAVVTDLIPFATESVCGDVLVRTSVVYENPCKHNTTTESMIHSGVNTPSLGVMSKAYTIGNWSEESAREERLQQSSFYTVSKHTKPPCGTVDAAPEVCLQQTVARLEDVANPTPWRALIFAARRASETSRAVTRFISMSSSRVNPWAVQIGELTWERSGFHCCDVGDNLPVSEKEPTTIVAYSLSTFEYRRALRNFVVESDVSCMRLKGIVAVDVCRDEVTSCPRNVLDSRTVVKGVSQRPSNTRQGTMAPEMSTSASPLRMSPVDGLCSQYRPNSRVFDGDAVRRSKEFVYPAASPWVGNSAKSEVSAKSVDTLPISIPRRVAACPSDINPNVASVGSPGLAMSRFSLEEQLLSQLKTHVKHRFTDVDEEGNVVCKFVCQAYWAMQFAAVRQVYIGLGEDEEDGFLRSLSMARPWNAQGGKSGATFLKTLDERFVVKQITRTELQMFLEYAPAYFEYLSKAFFQSVSTLLVKVLGVYQIGSHNRLNGRRVMEHVVVMENLFHERTVSRAFDLKGSTRARYARVPSTAAHDVACGEKFQEVCCSMSGVVAESLVGTVEHSVLLDENFIEYTEGRPLPLQDHSKAYFNSAVQNDTLFLSLINVVDYSILVGIDERHHELVVGIIDYMRQYDIVKKMERMGKSVGMIAGQAEPTVIQPHNYRNRFRTAMERYFMMVPDKWTPFRI